MRRRRFTTALGTTRALEEVVKQLNRLPGEAADQSEAWKEGVGIVEALLPAPGDDPTARTLLGGYGVSPGMTPSRRQVRLVGVAVRTFNRLAAKARVELRFTLARDGQPLPRFVQDVLPLNQAGEVVRTLWYALSGREWERLRRCDQCGTWFLDRSDSQTRRFCRGGGCSDRWWTRARRRGMRTSKTTGQRGAQGGRNRGRARTTTRRPHSVSRGA